MSFTVNFNINNTIKDFFSRNKSSSVFILSDENSRQYCLPIVTDCLPSDAHHIEIQSGEQHKTLQTVTYIWDKLFEHHADRKSLLVNLGGGVVSDMGGFAAASFKRGIRFINIPTTLLAQVDAASGGKTGINYGDLKNQIGAMHQPLHVFISPIFLKTLGKRQLFNGFAEMLKHALIADRKHLDELFDIAELINESPEKSELLTQAVEHSVGIKMKIAEQDINETGLRKILNFGHTFGHAFESFFFDKPNTLLHGEAVAFGMICELFISNKLLGFNAKDLLEITQKITRIYGKLSFKKNDFETLKNYMLFDKKNTGKRIIMSLLSDIEKPVPEYEISDSDITEALFFLNQLSK